MVQTSAAPVGVIGALTPPAAAPPPDAVTPHEAATRPDLATLPECSHPDMTPAAPNRLTTR